MPKQNKFDPSKHWEERQRKVRAEGRAFRLQLQRDREEYKANPIEDSLIDRCLMEMLGRRTLAPEVRLDALTIPDQPGPEQDRVIGINKALVALHEDQREETFDLTPSGAEWDEIISHLRTRLRRPNLTNEHVQDRLDQLEKEQLVHHKEVSDKGYRFTVWHCGKAPSDTGDKLDDLSSKLDNVSQGIDDVRRAVAPRLPPAKSPSIESPPPADDDGKPYEPAAAFDQNNISPDALRKQKHIRRFKQGGKNYYSVPDARRVWPHLIRADAHNHQLGQTRTNAEKAS